MTPTLVDAILSGKANSPPCFFVFCVRCIVKVSTFRKCSLDLLNYLGNENLVILQYQECINVYRVISEQLYFTRVEKNQKIMVSLDIAPLSKRTRWEIGLYLAAELTWWNIQLWEVIEYHKERWGTCNISIQWLSRGDTHIIGKNTQSVSGMPLSFISSMNQMEWGYSNTFGRSNLE